MPVTRISIEEFEEDLIEFNSSIEDISMEEVKREAARRTANELVEFIKVAIKLEDDITSPSTNSRYESGDGRAGKGPPLSTNAAWKVDQVGDNEFRVSPHDDAEQRVMVLNYGYPGRIYPDQKEALRFFIDGDEVFADSVEGPDPTLFWERAVKELNARNEFIKQGELVLEEEIEESFTRG